MFLGAGAALILIETVIFTEFIFLLILQGQLRSGQK